jgi:hypothetical protein
MRTALHKSLFIYLVLALMGMPLLSHASAPQQDEHAGCCQQSHADKSGQEMCDTDTGTGHDCSGNCFDCVTCAHAFSNVYSATRVWIPGLPDAQPVISLARPDGLTPATLYRPPRV